jgi:hypothetical protein
MRLSWIARDLATVVDGAPAATNVTKIAKAQDRARLLIAVIGRPEGNGSEDISCRKSETRLSLRHEYSCASAWASTCDTRILHPTSGEKR